MPQPSVLQQFSTQHGLLFVEARSAEGDLQEFVYSNDKSKRYAYLQYWDFKAPHVLWVMLNPGTGETEGRRRPTLERCRAWSKAWGYGGLMIGNVFASRTRSARDLLSQGDTADEYNESALRLLTQHAVETVVAWGGHGRFQGRFASVAPLLTGAVCLGVTASGHPRHPLYVPAATPKQAWLLPQACSFSL